MICHIYEAGDPVTHMKDAFWLAASYARPNQCKVNKNFCANEREYFFWQPHLASVREARCESLTMSSKRNRETGSCGNETGV